MKTNSIKKFMVGTLAAAVLFTSFAGTEVHAAQKIGTGFINKKVSSITPKITSFKRTGSAKAVITVKVPVKKAKFTDAKGKAAKGITKLSRKVNVRYGSTSGKNFEGYNLKAKVKSVKGNTVTIAISDARLRSIKNTYVTVSWAANKAAKTTKTNWSKLAKMNNKGFTGYKSEGGKKYGRDYMECHYCGYRSYEEDNGETFWEHMNEHYAAGVNSGGKDYHFGYEPSPKDEHYTWTWR